MGPSTYKGYEQWTGEENENNRAIYKKLAKLNMEELETLYPVYYDRLTATIPHAYGNVLEIGCGNGNITRWLAVKKNIKNITAVDISQYALNELKSYNYDNSEKITCICSSIVDFKPSRDEIFDTIILSEVIEHINLDDELNFLRKIKNNIRKRITIKDKEYGSAFVVGCDGIDPPPTSQWTRRHQCAKKRKNIHFTR